MVELKTALFEGTKSDGIVLLRLRGEFDIRIQGVQSKGFSETLKTIFKAKDIQTCFKPTNTLRQVLVAPRGGETRRRGA